MDLNDTQLDLLFTAYALSLENSGMVIKDECYPDAHRLAEAGWLERRFTDDGELSWWWTSEADTAIAFSTLVVDARERSN
jgi:hypothetical protein